MLDCRGEYDEKIIKKFGHYAVEWVEEEDEVKSIKEM
jgi:hypothetical protein